MLHSGSLGNRGNADAHSLQPVGVAVRGRISEPEHGVEVEVEVPTANTVAPHRANFGGMSNSIPRCLRSTFTQVPLDKIAEVRELEARVFPC